MKFITALAAAFLAAVISTTAFAQEEYVWPDDYVVQTMFASRVQVTSPTTYEEYNFGVQSYRVRLCTDDSSIVRYIRLGHTISASTDETTGDSTGMIIYAPTEAEFRNGTTFNRGTAVPFVAMGDLTDRACFTFPWQTRGITINASQAAASSTVINTDVWVFTR